MTPFIVAELSANHLGSRDRALAIVAAAAAAGADAIKLQTWTPDTMCIDPGYMVRWAGRDVSLVELYRQAHTPWEWHREIFELARELGMVPFSAAFDRASVDFLETLGVDRHKVASFELTDLPLIRYMASKGRPMIVSTGMGSYEEIKEACIAAGLEPTQDVTLLKCTSAYPADASDANLRTCDDWGGSWGISDHTMGIGAACAAAALGATMIEKHLTLARADGGPDGAFSMEPAEFGQMVTECRRAAAAVGEVQYGPGPNESTALRRSLWVIKDIAKGALFNSGNVGTARPALGLSPARLDEVLGMRAGAAYARGTPITWGMLS